MKIRLSDIYGNIDNIKSTEPLYRCFNDGTLDHEKLWDKEYEPYELTMAQIKELKSFSGYNLIKQFNKYATSENYEKVLEIVNSGKINYPVVLLNENTVLDGYHRVIASCNMDHKLWCIQLICD